MAAISWPRPTAATTVNKSPAIAAALTQSAAGDNAVTLDFYIEESADSDYTTDTILSRFSGVISLEGQRVVLTLTPRYWDGNDAYTSATNPTNASAPLTGNPIKVTLCNDIDAFYTVGGFTRTNPA